jgi:hypothetical protein
MLTPSGALMNAIRVVGLKSVGSRLNVTPLPFRPVAFQTGAEAVEITFHAQPEVIDAPFESRFVAHGFGRALPADDHDETIERDVHLRSASHLEIPDDLAAELVDVPAGSDARVLRDEMDMIESEARLRHDGSPFVEVIPDRYATSGTS